MVRLTLAQAGDRQMGSVPLISIGLFISISALVALCAKHAKRVSRTQYNESFNDSKAVPKSPLRSPRQLMTTASNKVNPASNKANPFISHHRKTVVEAEKFAPKSPLRSPRQLMATISNKAIPFIIHHQKKGAEAEVEADIDGSKAAEEGFGEGGLWQKEILMGDKCQPLAFSGVIYYDCDGNRISELPPRSPRASPLSTFSFPVMRDGNLAS